MALRERADNLGLPCHRSGQTYFPNAMKKFSQRIRWQTFLSEEFFVFWVIGNDLRTM
jgi:hypothetical protein